MKKYPFKFLDSYNREDRGIFFGRDEEINALYEMVFQSSVMLVYGGSGTGKTSLINCGLAGKFQPHDWLALMIRRGSNINDSLEKTLNDAGGNLSMEQVDTDWHDEWSEESETTTATLSPVARSIKAVYQKSFRPVYLIFDQFEELFIIGTIKEQELFIKTVQEILQSQQPVKLIFCIREEYLGYLFEFEKAVPQLMRKKLRIEPMNLEKVKQVIIGAAEFEGSNIRLKPGESEQIAETIFEKIKGKGKTLTIQLPFMQVFLDKFYIKITGDESREADAEFSMQKLNEMGEIGDVLINFLEEQVAGISKKLKDKYAGLTPEITWKILSPFSTLEGTKEPINKIKLYECLSDYDTVMIDDVVDAFINSRILRYNEATDMFEIAHDSIAKPIAEKRSAEETALLEIKRLIESQVAVKEAAREYFTEKQLIFIEPCLEKFKASDEELNWISKSGAYIKAQKEAEKKKRRKRIILAGIIILIGFTLLSLYAFEKTQESKRLRNIEFAQKVLIASNRAENDLKFPEAAFISRVAYQFYKENQGKDFRNFYPHLFHKLELLNEFNDKDSTGNIPKLDSNFLFSMAGAGSQVSANSIEVMNGYVYSGHSDGMIYKSKWADSMVQSEPFYDLKTGRGMHFSASPDKNHLAVCGFFPYVQVFDIRKKTDESVILKLPVVSDFASNIVYTDMGNLLVLTDSALAGWDSNLNHLIWKERKQFYYEGGRFISLSGDPRYPRINWNADSLSIPGVKFNCMAVFKEVIAVGIDSGLILIKNDSLIRFKLPHIGKSFSVQFDLKGNNLYIGSDDGKLTRMNLTGFSTDINRNHTNFVSTILSSNDGNYIATASIDGNVIIYDASHTNEWKYATPLILRLPKPSSEEFEPSPVSLDFSDDNKYVLAGYDNGAIYRWPVSADVLAELICDKLSKLKLNPDLFWRDYVDVKNSPVRYIRYNCKKVIKQ